MTEQEIDALALEYEKLGNDAFVYPSHATKIKTNSFNIFIFGYQAAMKENEKLKKEVELLNSEVQFLRCLYRRIRQIFEISDSDSKFKEHVTSIYENTARVLKEMDGKK